MCKSHYFRIVLFSMIIFCMISLLSAEIPNAINYQGRLTDDTGQPINDSKLIKFKIYGSLQGEDSLWSSGFQPVMIDDGFFEYKLGSNVMLSPDLFAGGDSRYLGITVDVGTEMEPRIQLVSVPYAYHAMVADTGKGTGWKIVNSSVILEQEDTYVLIGPGNSEGLLTVRTNNSSVTGVMGHDSAGVYGRADSIDLYGVIGVGAFGGYGVVGSNYTGVKGYGMFGSPSVLGENLSYGTKGALGYGTLAVSGVTDNPDHWAGYFSGFVRIDYGGMTISEDVYIEKPLEPLVIGQNIGSYSGNRIVISDTTTGSKQGLVMGEDSDNRCWLLWSNDDKIVDIGTKENGTNYGNTLTVKSGMVGIKTTAPNYTLDVRGTIGNNTTLYHSDKRWKQNIRNLSGSLERLMNLQGVQYYWKKNEYPEMNFPDGQQIGLVAQDVEKIFPEIVNESANGYKSIEYAKLVSVLIESVKEQQHQIEILSQRIEELEKDKNSGQ